MININKKNPTPHLIFKDNLEKIKLQGMKNNISKSKIINKIAITANLIGIFNLASEKGESPHSYPLNC